MSVIVPRLTGRRSFALQPVKSQGAGRNSSVMISTRDNQDAHFIFQNIYIYTSDCHLLCFIYCKQWGTSLPTPILYMLEQFYFIFKRDYTLYYIFIL